MATICARLINQNRFKYHILFSASFYETNEKDQRSDEVELVFNLNITITLTETSMDNIDIKPQL